MSHACLQQLALPLTAWDACAGSVLTPSAYITNVQKNMWAIGPTGFGHCRFCGSFLDAQLAHVENLQHLQSQTRALCLRSRRPGRTETRGPRETTDPQRTRKETHSRPADLFRHRLLSQDAARLWTFVWHPSMQQQPEETWRKLLLIEKTSHTTKEKSQTPPVQGYVYRPLGLDIGRSATHPALTRTPTVRSGHHLLLQRTANVTRKPSSTSENTESK